MKNESNDATPYLSLFSTSMLTHADLISLLSRSMVTLTFQDLYLYAKS
jgi:hypothetical protein